VEGGCIRWGALGGGVQALCSQDGVGVRRAEGWGGVRAGLWDGGKGEVSEGTNKEARAGKGMVITQVSWVMDEVSG